MPRSGGLDHLADDYLGFGRMFLEPGGERLVDDVLDHRAHFGGDELVLGLRGEFRIGDFHRKHGGETLATVVAGELDLFLFRIGLGITVDLARQRAAESGQMRAAVALRDVVGEAQHVLMIAVVPPERGLDADAVHLRAYHDRRGYDRLLVAIEISDELLHPAAVMHLLALLDSVTHVREHDIDAGIEESELAQAVLQRREIIFDVLEGGTGGKEGDFGAAAAALGFADHFERRHGLAMGEFDIMLLAVAPHLELQPARQRIDHGNTDAMQAARDLIGVLVEFSAGMQLGHDDLGRRHALALVDVDGYAASVVANRHGIVGVEDDFHQAGKTRERLVDRVIDDLVDHVMQARAVVGVADIHARPLADGIEAFQHPDRFRTIFRCNGMLGVGERLPGRFSHVWPSRMS